MKTTTYRLQVKSGGTIIYDRTGLQYIETIRRIVKNMMKENLSWVIPVIDLKFTSKITGMTCYLTIVREI